LPTLQDRFDRIDRNGDGQVTPRELPREALFKRLDRNGDGVIKKTELPGGNTRRPNRAATAKENAPAMPGELAHTVPRNIRHAEVDGVDPALLSLDLYVPKDRASADGRPVLVMIHGGGWRRGDKSGRGMVGAKMRHFVGTGYPRPTAPTWSSSAPGNRRAASSASAPKTGTRSPTNSTRDSSSTTNSATSAAAGWSRTTASFRACTRAPASRFARSMCISTRLRF
jgi:hypothetical protein